MAGEALRDCERLARALTYPYVRPSDALRRRWTRIFPLSGPAGVGGAAHHSAGTHPPWSSQGRPSSPDTESTDTVQQGRAERIAPTSRRSCGGRAPVRQGGARACGQMSEATRTWRASFSCRTSTGMRGAMRTDPGAYVCPVPARAEPVSLLLLFRGTCSCVRPASRTSSEGPARRLDVQLSVHSGPRCHQMPAEWTS